MTLDRADLAIRLVEERARTGYTQADFASKLGVSREGLRRYEVGERGFPAEFLAQAASLGVDVQYVLTGIRSTNVHATELAAIPAAVSVGENNQGNAVGIIQPGANVQQIVTQRHITRTVAEVKPGDIHIGEEQAVALRALVDKVVETEKRLKKAPRTHQSVWRALNAHCKVTQYRLILKDDFPKAQKYLHTWIGRLDSMASAPVKDGDAWRKRKYAYIKINSRDDPASLDRYIAKNFKASSISELDNDQLEQTYRYVAGRKKKK
jgi:transcriptional regulator with XRE-family HTH domain